MFAELAPRLLRPRGGVHVLPRGQYGEAPTRSIPCPTPGSARRVATKVARLKAGECSRGKDPGAIRGYLRERRLLQARPLGFPFLRRHLCFQRSKSMPNGVYFYRHVQAHRLFARTAARPMRHHTWTNCSHSLVRAAAAFSRCQHPRFSSWTFMMPRSVVPPARTVGCCRTPGECRSGHG
jgi:hypothetical protein